MDKVRDVALSSEQVERLTEIIPQEADEAKREAVEATATCSLEDRFANWGTD